MDDILEMKAEDSFYQVGSEPFELSQSPVPALLPAEGDDLGEGGVDLFVESEEGVGLGDLDVGVDDEVLFEAEDVGALELIDCEVVLELHEDIGEGVAVLVDEGTELHGVGLVFDLDLEEGEVRYLYIFQNCRYDYELGLLGEGLL